MRSDMKVPAELPHFFGFVILAFFIVSILPFQGCRVEPPAHLKFVNETDSEAKVTSARVNGKQVSMEAIELPPRTAQRYSPEGHAPRILLSDKDKLDATFSQNGALIQSSCVLRKRSINHALSR